MSSPQTQPKQDKGRDAAAATDADIPIDEVKAAAAEIQKDVTNALLDTKQSVQDGLEQIEKKGLAMLPAEMKTWLKRQRLTSRQYYVDLFSQNSATKALFGGLLFFNFFCSFLFLNRVEGWVVLTSYIGVSILSHCLYTLTPKSSPYRLFNSTLSHVVWIPMLFWLSHRSSSFDYTTSSKSMEHVDVSVALLMKKGMFFSQWLMGVMLVNTIALGNDIFQLVSILQNEKGVKNLKNLEKTVEKKVEKTAEKIEAKIEQVSEQVEEQLASEQLLTKEGTSQAERQYAFARQQQAALMQNEGLKHRPVAATAAPTA